MNAEVVKHGILHGMPYVVVRVGFDLPEGLQAHLERTAELPDLVNSWLCGYLRVPYGINPFEDEYSFNDMDEITYSDAELPNSSTRDALPEEFRVVGVGHWFGFDRNHAHDQMYQARKTVESVMASIEKTALKASQTEPADIPGDIEDLVAALEVD